MQFEFSTAWRVIFGQGRARELGAIVSACASRVLVLGGKNPERFRPLIQNVESAGVSCLLCSVPEEPTTGLVEQCAALARAEQCDGVLAIGGGSVVDAGKAIAALATNPGQLFDYLEVIGKGEALTELPLPYVAVPTTAGTGTEVTKNAVLKSIEHQVKVSLRSSLLLPKVALVDPELTLSVPGDVTASTGLDALTQLIEAFVSLRANPLTDSVCREGIRAAARSLYRCCSDGTDIEAREGMCVASLFSGLALANAGLGAVHGFAAVIGGMFPAPHGVVCARLLPHVMAMNLRALRQRTPASPSLAKYDEVARLLTGDNAAQAEQGVAFVDALCDALAVSGLKMFGLAERNFAEIVCRSKNASSMKGNPIALTDEELYESLLRAVG